MKFKRGSNKCKKQQNNSCRGYENSNIPSTVIKKEIKNIMHMMKKINLKKVKRFQLLSANLFQRKLAGNGIMIQTELTVADNTGAKRVECIKVYRSKRRYASVET